MINKYQVGVRKLGECASRFITVLSNVITVAYDIITDLSNVITDLSTFISKVFSWHPACFIVKWKWWTEFVFEIGFRAVFRNSFRNKKGPTNGPQYGFKILTYQNQFCQGSTSKIHNHFPIPELWRIRGEKILLDWGSPQVIYCSHAEKGSARPQWRNYELDQH